MLSLFWILDILTGVQLYLIVLICNSLIDICFWVSFNMFICHLYIFFNEVSVQYFCSFFKKSNCLFFIVDFSEMFCMFWLPIIYQTQVFKRFFSQSVTYLLILLTSFIVYRIFYWHLPHIAWNSPFKNMYFNGFWNTYCFVLFCFLIF